VLGTGAQKDLRGLQIMLGACMGVSERLSEAAQLGKDRQLGKGSCSKTSKASKASKASDTPQQFLPVGLPCLHHHPDPPSHLCLPHSFTQSQSFTSSPTIILPSILHNSPSPSSTFTYSTSRPTPPDSPAYPSGARFTQSSWLLSPPLSMASAAVCEDEPPGVTTTFAFDSLAEMQSPTVAADRSSLCITCSAPDVVLQKGDTGFREQVSRFFDAYESEANEGLIRLKKKLRTIHEESFWSVATQGFGDLLGAQYAFISKRIGETEGEILPAYGDPGSCLLGMSIYFNDGKGFQHTSEDSKYVAHGSPCAYMKHNKVLLIPENLSLIVTNNPNDLPAKPEAYMAVPLSYLPSGSTTEKVFGHFGVMWTAEGLAAKKLRYPHIENILHSLEDIMVSRFHEMGHLDQTPAVSIPANHLIPVSPRIAFDEPKPVATQSLKPYARSLSHELRTPMQGVVGMLDLMYAAVQEASEGLNDVRIRNVFQMLKENIEEVHDSARRAVEAADNVVHAYDMNMSVPDAPVGNEDDEEIPMHKAIEYFPLLSPNEVGTGASPPKGHKRQRSSLESLPEPLYKVPRISSGPQSTPLDSPFRERGSLESSVATPGSGTPYLEGTPNSSHLSLERSIAPGVRQTVISDTLQSIINDVLKIGGRPESAIAQPIDGGEEIEVRQRGQNGDEKVKMVRWFIEPDVPETILVDERDLAGLLSRVLHNAFKFTESGSITTSVRLGPKGKAIRINVTDTGHGIPKAFMPNLFKAFSKEDDSLTRQSEGLGLGLMVAKGLARRLNGDLYAVRSETDGPRKGTEFEMRIPLAPGEAISRPSTPYGSRSPSSASISIDGEQPTSHPASYLSKSPRPQLKPSGPRHSRSSSLLSRNVTSSDVKLPSLTQSSTSTTSSSGHIPTPAATLSTASSAVVTPTLLFETNPKQRLSTPTASTPRRNSHNRKTPPYRRADEKLAAVLPLAFLVVEDNSLLRKVLIQMLRNLGYTRIHEAYDGQDALRQMEEHRKRVLAGEVAYEIDFVLMDLWMPNMNGYSAAECILRQSINHMATTSNKNDTKSGWKTPIIMAVTADVTDEAMDSVAKSGMKGPLTKPYKQIDLERTLVEICSMPMPPPTSVA
jgi:signal transduction histidine kinase/CheY-like chemotaxis protein